MHVCGCNMALSSRLLVAVAVINVALIHAVTSAIVHRLTNKIAV
jgi:hypothetical protein